MEWTIPTTLKWLPLEVIFGCLQWMPFTTLIECNPGLFIVLQSLEGIQILRCSPLFEFLEFSIIIYIGHVDSIDDWLKITSPCIQRPDIIHQRQCVLRSIDITLVYVCHFGDFLGMRNWHEYGAIHCIKHSKCVFYHIHICIVLSWSSMGRNTSAKLN